MVGAGSDFQMLLSPTAKATAAWTKMIQTLPDICSSTASELTKYLSEIQKTTKKVQPFNNKAEPCTWRSAPVSYTL